MLSTARPNHPHPWPSTPGPGRIAHNPGPAPPYCPSEARAVQVERSLGWKRNKGQAAIITPTVVGKLWSRQYQVIAMAKGGDSVHQCICPHPPMFNWRPLDTPPNGVCISWCVHHGVSCVKCSYHQCRTYAHIRIVEREVRRVGC